MPSDRVLLITQYYAPDFTGTARTMRDLAEDLKRLGLKISVLAGKSRYAGKEVDALSGGDVPVRRIWFPHFNKDRKLGRILNYVSFPIAAFFFHLPAILKADKILIVSCPPTLIFIGGMMKLLFGKKVYFIIHDLYPDIAVALGALSKTSLLARLMNVLNRFCFPRAQEIVVLGEDMKNYFSHTYGHLQKNIRVITNWENSKRIPRLPRDNEWSREHGLRDVFLILYAGNIGFLQQFDPLIDVARHYEKDPAVRFLFVGEGGYGLELQNKFRRAGLSNVTFLKYVPAENYPSLLASADLNLICLKRDMEKYSFPGKFYSYLAAGRPVLGLCGKEGELATIIERENVGIFGATAVELCSAIDRLKADPVLREEMGNRGRHLAETIYDQYTVTKDYLSMLCTPE